MKILAINPKLKIFEHHIDYPYYLNLNLYLVLEKVKFGMSDIDIDIFDSFTIEQESFSKKGEYFFLGGDFHKEDYDKYYDYVIVNFSPYMFYHEENIKAVNDITSNFKDAKIIYMNYYSGGFCFMNFSKESLIKKGLKFDHFLEGNLETELIGLLGKEEILLDFNRLMSIYSNFFDKVRFEKYISFLKVISKNGLLDFYNISENTLPFYTSKGCIYNCSFCSSSNKNIKGYHSYDLALMEKEIVFMKKEYQVSKLIILDAIFNKDKAKTPDILNLFIKHEMKIEIPNGIRIDLLDESLIEKLSKVTSNISISIESGNQEINDKIIKKGLDLSKIEPQIQLLRKYGLNVLSHYIIGFPQEKISDINDTLELAFKLYSDYNVFPLVQFATPVPGTKIGQDYPIDEDKNLFEMFQTDYILDSKNFTKEDLIKMKDNFHKKVEHKKVKKLIINLTYLCLNNCIFCATGDRHKISQRFEYVVGQLIKYYRNGIRMVDLDGGEPTLYKDLIRVIKVAKKIGYENITITSSGRRFKDFKFLESVLESGIDNILISIHSSKKEIHNRITSKSESFDETIIGLDNILMLRKKYGFSFGINLTLCKINEDNLKEYLFFIERWKPEVLNIQFLTPFGNAETMEDMVYDIEKSVRIINENKNDLSYRIQLINIPFCQIRGLEENTMGDVGKLERNMIFVGENPSNLYDYLSDRRKRKSECDNCTYKIICDGFYH